jgi:GNAT superfamily N-acetyltransferase
LLKQVRLAALSDSPDAFSRTLDEAKRLPDTTWQERAAGSTSFSAIAIEANEPVGIAVGIPDADDETRAYLVSMWVAPGSRGTNIAIALLDLVQSWATDHGADTLFAGITKANTRAEAFYRKCGFETHSGVSPEHPAVSCGGSVLSIMLKSNATEQGGTYA